MTAVKVMGLSKSFGSLVAVDNVTLDIEEGELFALLGVNGAGKTTLIRMLTCLLLPDSGNAEIVGHSILTDTESAKEAVNVSPQETSVAPNLTVRENLEFMAGLYGDGKQEARSAAEKIISETGLGDVADRRAKNLSGGWQRRLSVAMALVTRPKVLFLDEPTLGLDVLARRQLWREIERLKGRVTVILTTHYLEEAEALSDRIAVMVAGKLRAVGTAQELIAQTGSKNFEDAFVAIAEEVQQ